MRKILVLLVIEMLLPNQILGKNRTRDEMDSIATSVLNKEMVKVNKTYGILENERLSLNIESSAKINTLCKDERLETSSCYPYVIYTFKSGRPGYMIISADNRLPAVIAFSEKESLSVNNISSAMIYTLKQYINRLSIECTSSNESKKYQISSDIASDVEPLLGEIAFSQRTPYNDKCPIIDGERTVTGCLATAMAQLMAYYKYPKKMFGDKIEYTTAKNNLSVSWDCSTTMFDWDNMLDTYASAIDENNKTTDEQYMSYISLKLSTENKQCLEISKLVNISTETINGNIQLLLADNYGNIICSVGRIYDINELRPRAGWGTSKITHLIPNNIADGIYRLYVGFKLKGSEEWSIMQRAIDETDVYNSLREECYVNALKTGTNYMIEGETFACTYCYNNTQANAVAILCAACGAATKMDYSTDGSSTDNNNITIGMTEYMGYDDKMFIITSSKFQTDGWIEKIIQSELKAKRPIYSCGTMKEGGSHAFVIDGCKFVEGIPYFHINWGWNGQDNGYFLLDYMTMSNGNNYGYAYSLTMGIKPNDEVDQGYTFAVQNISAKCNDTKLSIIVENISNCTIKAFSGNILIYAIDIDGKEYLLKEFGWDSWKESSGYGELNWNLDIPEEIPSGEYQIVLRAKERGSSTEKNVLTPSFPNVSIENDITSIDKIKDIDSSGSNIIYDLSGKKLNRKKKNQIGIMNGKKFISR